MENTRLNVEFPLDETKNFDNGYLSLIPSATFSFQYKQIHNFRFEYNLRIYRPFLQKKLTISFSGMNVFEETISYNSTRQTDQFRSTSNNSNLARNFRIGVSYKFGEMK